jgi:hypothetical protein
MPHKRFQTCHAQGVIDAEIAEEGHLWTETKSIRSIAPGAAPGSSIYRDATSPPPMSYEPNREPKEEITLCPKILHPQKTISY